MDAIVVIPDRQIDGEGVANVTIGEITLLQRTLRSLKTAGAEKVYVFGLDADQAELEAEELNGIEVEWIFEEDGSLMSQIVGLRDEFDKPIWMIEGDRMIFPEIFELLSGEDSASETAHAGVRDAKGDLAGLRIGEQFFDIAEKRVDEGHEPDVGDVARELSAIGALEETYASQILSKRVCDSTDIEVAREQLFDSLRRPLSQDADGIIAYYFNRLFSLSLTKQFVKTKLTPNALTVIGLVFGLVAGSLLLTGQWLWIAVAGVLLQFSSLFDGVDGEIARAKVAMSDSGAWLDRAADDILNIGLLTILGYAVYLRQDFVSLLVWGAVGIAGFSLVVGIVFYWNHINKPVPHFGVSAPGRRKQQERYPAIVTATIRLLGYLVKRDTVLLTLAILFIANQLTAALYVLSVFVLISTTKRVVEFISTRS